MTDDITKRLRGPVKHPQQSYAWRVEAADEILRLRAELDYWKKHSAAALDRCEERCAERDALRAELAAEREERVSILVEIADALTTAIRKERWDIVIHVRDAVKETNRV